MAVQAHNHTQTLKPDLSHLNPKCRYTNGAFCVDMPRGCVTVMEEGSYAANGLKHCVRPVDMAGAHFTSGLSAVRSCPPCVF